MREGMKKRTRGGVGESGGEEEMEEEEEEEEEVFHSCVRNEWTVIHDGQNLTTI